MRAPEVAGSVRLVMRAAPTEPFSFLHFQGDRFGGPYLHLGALGEFGAYERAIHNASRFLFLAENPHRVRVSLDLNLVVGSTELGLTTPRVDRVLPQPPLHLYRRQQAEMFPSEPDDKGNLYAKGRALLFDLVDSGGRSKALQQAIQKGVGPTTAAGLTLVSSLSELGGSLADDEQLGLRGPSARRDEVVLTPAFGEHLLYTYGLVAKPKSIRVKGVVRMADRDANRYTLKTEAGRVRLEAPPLFFGPLGKNLTSEKPFPIEVRGVGYYRGKKLWKIVAEDFIAAPRITLKENATSSIDSQLSDLGRLAAGWGDVGDELAPSAEFLAHARSVLAMFCADYEVPAPFLYPTEEGTVRAEWPGAAWNVAMEIGDDLKIFFVQRAGGSEAFVRRFPLTEAREGGKLVAEKLEVEP